MIADDRQKAGYRFYPGVSKTWLILLAGTLWLGVGFMLCKLAAIWLTSYTAGNPYYYSLPGILAALVIHHFGFLRIADKNLDRIASLPAIQCFFSFMSWKSYLLVAFMMTLGITLRHSEMPKQYLSVLYIAIGLALILSSLRYFHRFFRDVRKKSRE